MSQSVVTTLLNPTTISATNSITNDSVSYTTSALSSTKSNIHLLDQLFLQTTTCQILTGFFAWAALLITIHHVCIFLNNL